jgi:hypothetical protein
MSSVYKIEKEFYKANLAMEEANIDRARQMIQDIGQCPRSADEAYSMGVKMQGFIGGIMAENISEAGSREEREAVKRQLAIKNRIRQLADFNLNQLLDYFYNNGGPVIEPPVSEYTAKEIQPFFNRIAMNALIQMMEAAEQYQGNLQETVTNITDSVVSMYEAMGKLYPETNEVKTAFAEMRELHKN